MEQQTSICKLGKKLEGVFKPFGEAMYASEYGGLGQMAFAWNFHELGKMVIDLAMKDVVQRPEDDPYRQQAHAWMGKTGNATGSFAFWLQSIAIEDALVVLSDDERRVLSAAFDPKSFEVTKEYCTRERFRLATDKVLRKLRTMN